MSEDIRRSANELMARGKRAARRKDHAKARTYYEEAVELRKKAYGRKSKWVAESLEKLADSFSAAGAHEAALGLLEEALEIRKSVNGGEHASTADTLHALGRTAYFLGRLGDAKAHNIQALAIRRQLFGETHPDVAASLNSLGVVADTLGEHTDAHDLYRQALAIWRQAFGEVHPYVAASLNNLAIIADALGEHAEARDLHRQTLAIKQQLFGEENADVAASLNNLGLVASALGEHAEARDLHRQALAIHRQVFGKTHPAVATSLNNLANVAYALGEHAEARDLHRQALAIRRQLFGETHPGVAMSLNNLANVASALGEHAEARDLHRQALATRRQVFGETHADVAASLNNLGVVANALGEHAEARDLHRQALAIRRQVYGETHVDVAASLNNLGLVASALGEHAEARDLHRQALAIHRQAFGETHPHVATSLNNLANVAKALGEHAEARDLHRQALAIRRQAFGETHIDIQSSLINLGETLRQLNDLLAASSALHEALRISFNPDNIRLLPDTHHQLSLLETALGNRDAAIFLGKQAVNALQRQRSRLTDLEESLQRSFAESKADVYRHLADLLVEAGRFAEAEQVLAMLKEQELFDLLRRDAEAFGPMTFSMLVGVEVKWNEELEAIGKVLADIISGIEALEKIENRSAEEEARLTALQAEREAEGARLSTWLDGMAAAMSETSGRAGAAVSANLERAEQDRAELASLGGQIARLSYILTENRLSIIVTTASLQTAREGEVSEKVINRLVHELRSAMMSATDSVRLRPAAEALWKHLITPVEDILRSQNITTLMIVPYGTLRYLPFAALCGPSGGDQPHYLNDRYAVTVLTLAAGDGHLAPVDPDWTVAGLGVEREIEGWRKLETVRQELSGIVRQDDVGTGIYPGTIRLDEAFDEAGLAAALKEHDAVHVASHFALDTGQALNSKLLLGDGSALTLDRLRSDDFDFGRTELITLSACQTAMGASTEQSGRRQEDGSEFEGFAALVQRRGARSVIASLWAVADASTAPFMIEFYRARSTGLTKAEALRQAQISLRANPQFAHSYHWAPFVLMGNWR